MTFRLPTLALLALPFLASCAVPPSGMPVTQEQQAMMTPAGVVDDLMAGNERFVSGQARPTYAMARVEASAGGQYPKAVILSCLDSRVPVEQVFDQGIGDVFVGRVAGNIETAEQLGSMEFAAKLVGVKAVMVLGHSACGAVKGACDGARLGNLTGLLKQIQPAVDAVPGHSGQRDSKNSAFVEEVVEENVRQTMEDIRSRSPLLAEMEAAGDIAIVGAIYSLETGRVTLLD